MVEMKGLEEEYNNGYGAVVDKYENQQAQDVEAGKKQTGYNKKDIIDNLCTSVNQDLLISKTFYFFFFSAFGSLFPLLAVYFKQLGMNATQSGILIGIRPFVEFLSAPLWGNMADRFRKGKMMLLLSLASWIVFTLALAFIHPPASSCVTFNTTHHILYHPDAERSKRSANFDEFFALNDVVIETNDENKTEDDDTVELYQRYRRQKEKYNRHSSPPNYVIGKSPNSVEYTLNYDKEHHTSYISPPFSSIVYRWEDIQEVFFLLLLLVILGEFFSAPSITLADSATLSFLGDNTDSYGKQRMFGSLGWGLAMFFVGIALDHSTTFIDHPCGPHEKERNYTICFATFSVLMGCAFIAATQFRFDYDSIDDNIPMKVMQNGPNQGNPQIVMDGAVKSEGTDASKGPGTAKSTVFAQTTRKLPEWFTVLRTFATLRYGAFLYVTWFMGFGIGLVFTFLFWHLQDLGGTPTLFGVASVINHISEIFAYFFSFKFIRQIGHTKVLCIGLGGNVCRFLYISWLRNPWWVLPFEFVQGITHAAVWAACCSYITQSTPATLRSSAQGVLQGLHHGLGRGCGAVIGGIFVTHFGTQVTFRGYGFACLIVLFLFILINYYRKDKGFSSFQDEQEPGMVIEETSHLAPHGVPANPMARSLSKQNLEDQNSIGNTGRGEYGATNQGSVTPGGFLGIPGGGENVQGSGTYSDFNMNNTSSNGNYPLTRRALAAAFNPKGILAAASPEAVFEYDTIRRDFQAYKEVTMFVKDHDENLTQKQDLLEAYHPETTLFTPQPAVHRKESDYDW
ncbi:major facilitator superfamily domain-containing protein 6-like [Centruroides sculpturatus]|uniref:major facilitator superfamily domain-containing protein 6-like n=1 Tax=Centruroides sculpturatus TaxID=218467 RepID=UPI000C6D9D34|nr:major facilitator superfamily domain-containing protein 6-like [Centruroides sculpturatus]